ncbi:RimJ/RimL family protein N-acetyltransferase [Tahibacter aquaticus]|uniref:RimJ/RimL family protein N-acetyltransferase n=1 Tax=Tahibacter aquaticus TaxID=520092 RepID=A0A4R6YIT9_9GAMM|nr:GNAT family protein [Tahibacter aquaticus]TDR36683.1 RimJ/RimL family protein N-acetyltransferase [Tahibacter aquaticus]
MADTLSAVPLLETPRLRLRTVRRDDLAAIYALHADPRAMRYWSCAPWTQAQQAEDWFAQRARQGETEEIWPWGISRIGADTLIGLVTVFAVNRSQHRAEIGYLLDPAHWGKGYAREALRAALAYGFEALQLLRVEADIDPRNEASCRLVEKLGFRREGYLRERWRVNGEITDTALYGLLRRELTA